MTQNLHEMTTSELKQYISEHRNNEEAFREALQVLLSRQDPNTPRYPYPFDLADPEGEVETLLKEHLNRSK
jgi:hypothetical protein